MTEHAFSDAAKISAPARRPRTHKPRPLPNLTALPPHAALDRQQVCAATGFALQTLKVWAKQGRGPRITYLEGRPRYLVRDVLDWMGVSRDATKSA
ncbi:hypothetical protein [Methylocystis parvus]|uniref:hypothetical protein n=1 Tax=Methylocystis parvus TaxID=134 RepID=UPI003C717750